MLNNKYLVGTVVSLSLLLSPASAQMPDQTTFRRIEQPIGLKIGVTLGGLALIGTELWWFVFSKTKSQQVGLEQRKN